MEQFKKKDLIIFSNGPGEVSTWVQPVVEAVQKRGELSSMYRILLIVHPCPFGSGTEGSVARGFEGIEEFIGPGEYLKILFTGLGRRKFRFSREGVIFSLGGDLMHPVLFRRRIKGRHTLYAYTKNQGWSKYYEKIFVRSDYVKNKMLKQGVSHQKLKVSGDLVYSSLKFLRPGLDVRKELDIKDGEKMVVFLPGSRDFEVWYMLPMFLKVISDIADRISGVKPFLLKSPYISYDFIVKVLANGGNIKVAESIPGELKRQGNNFLPYIEFSGGKRVSVLEKGLKYWGEGIDFAVTVPGTNTIQLAYREIPSLVVAPLNKPELYPVEGPLGLLKWIPLIGNMILKKAVFKYLTKFPYASLPNMYENEEIFPELFKVIQTDEITDKIIEIFTNKEHEKIKKKLSRFKPDDSPADLIIQEAFGDVVRI